MAKQEKKRIIGVNASTVATYYGTFGAIVGLTIAVIHSLRTTIDIASDTQSVVSGLAFGLTTGIVSILVLPLIYFGIMWVIGYVNGFIFNVVASSSGGIGIILEEDI